MITRGLIWALGTSQLVCWGTSYYLLAVFGGPIAAETGWSLPLVFGGQSAAIVVMGLVSPAVGRFIDRHGGRPVMVAGSCLIAIGCVGLALARDLATYYAAWIVLGLAMRMSLYDAAFAALARIAGREARRPISQVTLLGGLASTALWPIGQALSDAFGWRAALLVYAALGLATVPLHWAIPAVGRTGPSAGAASSAVAPRASSTVEQRWAAGLYTLGLMLTTFLASAMSAHQIALLSGLGVATATAVWVSALRGVGQSGARLCEILFGRRLDPLALGVIATALLPLGFAAGFGAGASLAAALTFSLLYGAGNGLSTIVRGTQPLVLFDPAVYGSLVGRLAVPSFFASAAAPVAFAAVIERHGPAGALWLSLVVAGLALLAAVALWRRFRDAPPPVTRPTS